MAFHWQTALEYLRNAHARGRLAHAYLLYGVRGSGQERLAEHLAAMVNGEALADERAQATSPDVHRVAPESKSRRILIDQMRELETRLQRKPNVGPMKIGIIREAERINPQAANAFLKTLEEPPSNSLILLLTESPESLLDTIISRCIGVPLRGVEELALPEEDAALLAELARVSPAAANGIPASYTLVAAFQGALDALRQEITEESEAALKAEHEHYKDTTDGAAWLKDRESFYDAMTQSRLVQRRGLLVEHLIQWWADVLKQKVGGGGERLEYPRHQAVTSAWAEALGTPEIMRRLKAVEQLHEAFNFNVNEALALEVAFMKAFAPAGKG
jgi:DNA polymerase-3 subunit delta'